MAFLIIIDTTGEGARSDRVGASIDIERAGIGGKAGSPVGQLALGMGIGIVEE